MDSLIHRLEAAGARHLVIGGQAMRLLGMPRFSMDWDFFIPGKDVENMVRISHALGKELDVELEPLGPRGENLIQTYQTRWGVLQFHLAVPGVPSFAEAERRSVVIDDPDEGKVRCLCPTDLLASKRAANRPQDQQDIAFLGALLKTNG